MERTPQKVRSARPASQATIYLEKIVSTPDGDRVAGGGTGFLYRHSDTTWLVTCWHVLTGRRPDDVGNLINASYGQSPYQIRASFPRERVGAFLPPVTLDLYQAGAPIWRESDRERLGVDIAAIPISLPEGAVDIAANDFAPHFDGHLEPGFDVIITGYPMGHGQEKPFPFWKRAMIASEPSYMMFGVPQTLVDTPGSPGMSGAPVYISKMGQTYSGRPVDFEKARQEGKILEALRDFEPMKIGDDTVLLKFVGIYAGSTGSKGLDAINLGRMFMASFVEAVVVDGVDGINPFPPTAY